MKKNINSNHSQMFMKYIIIIGIIIITGILMLFILGYKSTQVTDQFKLGYAKSTFDTVNTVRANSGLNSLELDMNLCNYAKIKAEQLANSEISNINIQSEIQIESNQANYFGNYDSLGLTHQGGGKLKRPDKNLAEIFFSRGTQAASNNEFTHGCVADSTASDASVVFTVFIGGKQK